MYITINGSKFSCTRRESDIYEVRYYGVSPTPESVSGEIALYTDEDFLLRTDPVSAYARQIIDGARVTLTNRPETVIPEPVATPTTFTLDNPWRRRSRCYSTARLRRRTTRKSRCPRSMTNGRREIMPWARCSRRMARSGKCFRRMIMRHTPISIPTIPRGLRSTARCTARRARRHGTLSSRQARTTSTTRASGRCLTANSTNVRRTRLIARATTDRRGRCMNKKSVSKFDTVK